jgi:hypothetical protein
MSTDMLVAIRSGYRAIGLGVGDAMLRLFGQGSASEVTRRSRWLVVDLSSGHSSRGRDVAAEDLFGSIPPHWQVTRVEPRSITPEDGAVVVTGHILCRPKGRTGIWDMVRVPFAHIWYLRDGEAVRVRSYLDGIDLVRA